MKSKKAEEYLNRCYKPGNANMKEKRYSREMCNKAVEIAEQEMKDKAIQAFSFAYDFCDNTAENCSGCDALNTFLNKL